MRAEIYTALGNYSEAVEGYEKKAYAYYWLSRVKEALQACVAAITLYARENKKTFDLQSDYHLKIDGFMNQILAKARTAFGKSLVIFFYHTLLILRL